MAQYIYDTQSGRISRIVYDDSVSLSLGSKKASVIEDPTNIPEPNSPGFRYAPTLYYDEGDGSWSYQYTKQPPRMTGDLNPEREQDLTNLISVLESDPNGSVKNQDAAVFLRALHSYLTE